MAGSPLKRQRKLGREAAREREKERILGELIDGFEQRAASRASTFEIRNPTAYLGKFRARDWRCENLGSAFENRTRF
jgi:hypothetical protein